MNIDKIKCSKVALGLSLLSALGSEATFAASQPAPGSTSTSHALSSTPFSFNLRHGHTQIQLGGYWSSQGQNQDVNINGLVGNQYTVSDKNQSSWNGLFGIGYFIDGYAQDKFQLSYGVNGFYLAQTPVSGNIVQEHLFTNLYYRYTIQHVPVYFATKAKIKINKSLDYEQIIRYRINWISCNGRKPCS